MKKVLLILLLIFTGALSFGATEKRVYLIIPGDIVISEEVYTGNNSVGKIEESNMYSVQGMVSKGSLEKIELKSIESYSDGEAQLLEVKMKLSEDDAKVKLAMNYMVSHNKYVILADKKIEATTVEKMKENYFKKSFSSKDLIDPSYDKSNYDYISFPGYEVKENSKVLSIIVGDKKISDKARSKPSNIIEKLEKNGEGGSVEGKIRINPGNNHFKLIDLNEDKYVASDFKSFLKEAGSDYIYFDGSAKELEFKVIGGDYTVEIDGVETTFKSGEEYNYNDLKRVVLLNENGKGNGHWYVSLSGKPISFQPDEVEDDEFYIKAADQYYMFDDDDDDYSDYDDDNLRLRKVTLKENPDWHNEYEADVEEWGEILDYVNEYPEEPINKDTWYTFFDGPIEELRFEYDHDRRYLPEEGLNKIDDDDYRYVFNSSKRMVLKGKMDDDNEFDDDGELWHISFPEEDTQEEIFIIAGVGDVLEASINMKSGKKDLKSRQSNIEIDLLNGKGIEIKSIKE